jgi:N utilization substance protein B
MAPRGRHGARRLLVQALYQNQVGGHDTEELVRQFSASTDFDAIDRDYFLALLNEIFENRADLESHISDAADRPIEQLDPVERGLLWLGTAELQFHPDAPVKVVINEAIQLAKEFGAEDSYRYVNAILDKVAAKLR